MKSLLDFDLPLFSNVLKEVHVANGHLESFLASDPWYRFRVVVISSSPRPIRVEFGASVSWYDCEGMDALRSTIGRIMFTMAYNAKASEEHRRDFADTYPDFFRNPEVKKC